MQGITRENVKILPPDDQPITVDFHTVDGVFIKQIVVAKRDSLIPSHSHAWDHTTMLAKGSIFVWKDGVLDKQYRAPAAIFIKAGVKHTFATLTDDTILYCIHNLHGEQAVKILEEHQLTDEI